MKTYPQSSSHLTNWIFSEAQLNAKRLEVNELARKGVLSVADSPSLPQLLSVEEEAFLVSYFASQLVNISKDLPFHVKNTSLTFFNRFYLTRSVYQHDPRILLFTCLLLAAKCEEVARSLRVSDLLKGAVNPADVFQQELPVLEALGGQLLILHAKVPLEYLSTQYYSLNCRHWSGGDQPNKGGGGEGGSAVRRSVNASDELKVILKAIQQKAEELCLNLHSTDIPFLFPPAQIAAAVFTHLAAGKLPDVEAFVLKIFERTPSTHLIALSSIKDIRARLLLSPALNQENPTETQQRASALVKRLDAVKKFVRKASKKRSRAEISSGGGGSVAGGGERVVSGGVGNAGGSDTGGGGSGEAYGGGSAAMGGATEPQGRRA
eukprot:GHVN01086918.1.p1 GENE.GHVN01086918.1~~GHVN01086918.1.p1  ORF type:complete len:378 (+),score=72.66 GHVN01086918.1:26-1159(+)